MKTVVILYSTDQWNGNPSLLGVFSNKKKAFKAIPAKLDEDDITMLDTYNQTQGRDENFQLDEVIVNQLN